MSWNVYSVLLFFVLVFGGIGVYDLLWNRPGPLDDDGQPDRRGDDD